MARIILNDGREMDHPDMIQSAQTRIIRMVSVSELAAKLESMRREWEEEAPELETVEVPLYLALADMAGLIGLSPEETQQALGERLYKMIE